LALPGDRTSSIGSESLGRVSTLPLVVWEVEKVTDFPLPLPFRVALYQPDLLLLEERRDIGRVSEIAHLGLEARV
jgi:hypothetical protein